MSERDILRGQSHCIAAIIASVSQGKCFLMLSIETVPLYAFMGEEGSVGDGGNSSPGVVARNAKTAVTAGKSITRCRKCLVYVADLEVRVSRRSRHGGASKY